MLHPLRSVFGDPALRLVVWLLLLIGALAASNAPYMSLIAIEVMGYSDAGYSALMAAAAVVNVAAALSVGIMSDRHGRRRMIAAGCAILLAAGGALMWALPSAASLAVTHVLFWSLGFTLLGQVFALARLAVEADPSRRDGVLATVRAFFALAFIGVLPFWSWGISNGWPLTSIYIAATFLGLAMLALVLFAWPRDSRWEARRSGLSVGAALAEIAAPRVALGIALLMLVGAGLPTYMSLTGLLFNAAPGRSAADAGLFVGLVAGLEVPVMLFLAPWALARWSKPRLIAVAAFLHAIFLATFGQTVAEPWVWLLALPAAVAAGMLLTVPIAYLQDLMHDRPGTGGALLAVTQVGAQLVSTLVFALGTALSGYTFVTLLASAVMVAGGALLILTEPRTHG